MVAEPDVEDDHAEDGGPIVFVRDFAGKAFLLFLYHDLGYWLRNAGANEAVFGGGADEIGRSIAPFFRQNIRSDQYRRLFERPFFDAAVAVLKQGAPFSHETFLAAVKSDRDDGSSLTDRRKTAGSPSSWIYQLSTGHLVWMTAAHLLGIPAKPVDKDEDERKDRKKNVGFGTQEAGGVPIQKGSNRWMLQLFSGARLRDESGTIGTLERTPASWVANGYKRDHVTTEITESLGNTDDYTLRRTFLTQVETRILLRLACGFGFGCNCDVTEPLAVWDSTMTSEGDAWQQAAWEAFAGAPRSLAGQFELRGGSLAEFSEAYFALLQTAKAGGFGSLYTGRPITRTTEARRKVNEKPDQPGDDRYEELWLKVDYPDTRTPPCPVDYNLHFLGQSNVGLQMTATWSPGERRYAFRDLRLNLNFKGVQEQFRIPEDSWASQPAPMINGGTVNFDFAGFFPDNALPMHLSDVVGLTTYPIFPGRGVELFRFARATESARFEGELHVRAGSLARVDGQDDDSAKAALRRAVEQFLMLHGHEGSEDQTFVPVARKGWTMRRGRD